MVQPNVKDAADTAEFFTVSGIQSLIRHEESILAEVDELEARFGIKSNRGEPLGLRRAWAIQNLATYQLAMKMKLG
jgi:hypothetical protein